MVETMGMGSGALALSLIAGNWRIDATAAGLGAHCAGKRSASGHRDAGAEVYTAVLADRRRPLGQQVAVRLTSGNADRVQCARVLSVPLKIWSA